MWPACLRYGPVCQIRSRLMQATDLRVAAESASFALQEVK